MDGFEFVVGKEKRCAYMVFVFGGMGDWVNTLAYIHGADHCSLLSFGIYNTTVQILRR